ncbi:MAG TPA: cytochrome c-type biogenesis protein [Rhizomicrobium sp.]|nr:cytochrome c-type biogenesis protein [Rhizomicrobium sp.]
MKRALLALLLSLLCAGAAYAITGPDRLSNPALEARAVALQKQLRCVVCQGQSLDESNAPLAADLRRLIRARIAAGDSDAQVEQYLVARYGDFILMKPPLQPDTYLLWFGPLGILLIGGTAVALVIFRARRRFDETAGR